jgi:hypothetical protein
MSTSRKYEEIIKDIEKLDINLELIGPDLQPDDEHDIIICRGIDKDKNKYIKLKIKKKIDKKE